MLFFDLNSVLVASDPALAECGEVAAVVDSRVPVSWDDGERWALGDSCLLGSRSVPVVCIGFPTLFNFAT